LIFVRYRIETDPNTPPDVYIVGSEQLREFLEGRRQETISLDALDDEVHAREAWQRLAIPSAA